MRQVNQQAQLVLDKLTEGLVEPGDSRKIDNSNGTYMKVHVAFMQDVIEGNVKGKVFSIAHYYTQNGDLMSDPTMQFLKSPSGSYYPISYRQDGLGIYRESVQWDDNGGIVSFSPREQRDEAIFAGQWMKNIKTQQEL